MRMYVPDDAHCLPVEAKKVFQGEIFEVYQWPQTLFDGSVATFEMLRRPDTVEVIGIKDDKIVIIKQKQPGRNWYYVFPGGRVEEDDQNELEAAKREMREETGLIFKNYKLIKVKQPQKKIDWLVYVFVASDFERAVPAQPDSGEEIEVIELKIGELQELLRQEPDTDYLKQDFLMKAKSVDDLLSLPSLCEY